jgi:hypothetical protein
MEKYKQEDFFDKIDPSNEEEKTETSIEKIEENNKEENEDESETEIEDDGLDFNCEYCMDRPGGCSQCGFGRNNN